MNKKNILILNLVFAILTFSLFAGDPWSSGKSLKKHISKDSQWIVLGFVADSENTPTIESKGHKLRKSLELYIQNEGGSVLTMSRAERIKWEKMWSLPYKGRYPKSLIDGLAKAEKVNVISGSYAPHSPSELTVLIYNQSKGKSEVVYLNQNLAISKPKEIKAPKEPTSIVAPKEIKISQDNNIARRDDLKKIEPRKETRKIEEKDGFFKNITSTRHQALSGTFKRRRLPRSLKGKVEMIKTHLDKSEVMKEFVKPYKDKSPEVIENDIVEYIEKSKKTFFSSGKVENMCRAYALSNLLEGKEEFKKGLLEQIAEHHAFSVSSDKRR